MQGRTLTLIAATLVATSAAAGDMQLIESGSRPGMIGSTDYFTGTAYVEPLFSANEPFRSNGAAVTFLPGARSNWHTHPGGQILIVTEGTGWVQQEGSAKLVMQAGDVIWTPPGVKHWHGATDTTAVTHLAIQQYESGKVVDWKEPVSDAQYLGAPE